MKIKATQEVEVDVNVLEFLNKLQITIVGYKYSTFNEVEGNYYITFNDETQVNPWIRRNITETQYKALQGIEDAKKYFIL